MAELQKATMQQVIASRLGQGGKRWILRPLKMPSVEIECVGTFWIGANHVDLSVATQSDYHKLMGYIGRSRNSLHGGEWNDIIPARLEHVNDRGEIFIFACAFHCRYHSVSVGGFNPAGFTVIRGIGARPHERINANTWAAFGTHICVWFSDTWILRGRPTSAWNLRMRDAVIAAESHVGATAPTPIPTPTPTPTNTYVVVSGDTLSAIARRFNTTVGILVQLNGISNPDRIAIGQRLILPCGENNHTPPQSGFTEYRVRIATQRDPLRVRAAPGTEHSTLGRVDRGTTQTIIAERKASDGSLWGEIRASGVINNGWIKLAFTEAA